MVTFPTQEISARCLNSATGRIRTRYQSSLRLRRSPTTVQSNPECVISIRLRYTPSLHQRLPMHQPNIASRSISASTEEHFSLNMANCRLNAATDASSSFFSSCSLSRTGHDESNGRLPVMETRLAFDQIYLLVILSLTNKVVNNFNY